MKKINILHFRNCRGISTLTGPETYLLDLLHNVDNMTFNTLLACDIDPTNKSHFFIYKLKKKNIRYKLIELKHYYSLKDFFVVSRMIKKHRIDILHTHDFRSDVIGLLLSKKHNIPIIAFAHGWVNWSRFFSKARLYSYLETIVAKFADIILVSSLYMKNDSIKRGIPKEKIVYIPIGIDIHKFNFNLNYKKQIRKEFFIPLDSPLIGTVGRIHPWKGQIHFLKAANKVSHKIANARFLIVGDVAYDGHKRYKHELLKNIYSLNLKDKVILTGSRDDIPQIMNAIDLFVLPSVHEPFGLVLLEAQACRRPVVSTSVGGAPETMEDGVTGILVKPEDGEALANAILFFLGNRERMRKMGLAGRKRIEDRFSKDGMVSKTEELYRIVLNRFT